MADARLAKTPAEAGPICIEEEEVLSSEDTTYFRSATGSLLYLSRCTKPDITHSVMVLTRSISKPGPRATSKLKGVPRYFKGTIFIGINSSGDAEDGDKLTAYVCSDHAGDQYKGYSTTAVVLFLAGGPVDWRSVKQTVAAISTVKAEYVALSKACTMILSFCHLMETTNEIQNEAMVVFEDNSGAVALSRSNKITSRTKHVDVTFHHVRSLVADDVVDVTYIETELQRADILTKNLVVVKFLKNVLLLLGV